jgi:trigger factor
LKVEYVEETSVRKALTFEIESEVVEKEIETRARDYAKRVKLPGFRPGKTPTEVIKKRFRSQVLEDVAETVVNRVVLQEIEGRGLKPLANPRVTDLKIDENQPMTFRAVFETLPIVDLPEYKGLEAKSRTPSVSEIDVDREIDRLREDAARFDPIEGRPLAGGDFAVLDLAWRPVDGGRGGRDENAMIEVGSEHNHKDFNAGLPGMSVGETRDLTVTYEKDHESERLAGKSIRYTANLKAMKQKILPGADDEFAKDLDFENLAALKDDVRKRLTGIEERRVDREVKDALIEALVQRASFEVPEALIERHMNARTENAARGLAMQGVDPSKIGMDWKGYRDSQREESVKAAKADVLLDEIARREGVEALDGEVDAELARLAERMKKSKEAVRLALEKEGDLPALRARIREDKTLDLLKANARLDSE